MDNAGAKTFNAKVSRRKELKHKNRPLATPPVKPGSAGPNPRQGKFAKTGMPGGIFAEFRKFWSKEKNRAGGR
jgi:hypothetical protein